MGGDVGVDKEGGEEGAEAGEEEWEVGEAGCVDLGMIINRCNGTIVLWKMIYKIGGCFVIDSTVGGSESNFQR